MIMPGNNAKLVLRWLKLAGFGATVSLLTFMIPVRAEAQSGDFVASVGLGLHIDDYDVTEFAPRFWEEDSDTSAGVGGKLALGIMLSDSLELGISLLESYTSDEDLFQFSPVVYLTHQIPLEGDVQLYVGPQIGGTYYDFGDHHFDDFGFSAGALIGVTWSGIFIEYNFLWTDIDTEKSWRDVEGDLYSHRILAGLRFEF